MTSHISQDTVAHVAKLAQLPLRDDEAASITAAFEETLTVVDNLKTVNTSTVEPTHQVTGLENILREDMVDTDSMFTQDAALANAANQFEGYFVVERILDHD